MDTLGGQLSEEYNKGLTFYYECIMSVLGKEYPELNMSKLEAGVDAYMTEQDARTQRPEDSTPNAGGATAGTEGVVPPVEEDPPVAPPAVQDPPAASAPQVPGPMADPPAGAP